MTPPNPTVRNWKSYLGQLENKLTDWLAGHILSVSMVVVALAFVIFNGLFPQFLSSRLPGSAHTRSSDTHLHSPQREPPPK